MQVSETARPSPPNINFGMTGNVVGMEAFAPGGSVSPRDSAGSAPPLQRER